MRLSSAPAAAFVGSVVVTTAVTTLPFLRFAYRSEGVHVALETTAAIVATVAAFLVVGRVLAEGRRADVVLSAALATLGGTNLVFGLGPALLVAETPTWADWAALAGRLGGSVLLVSAAYAGTGRVRRPTAAVHAAVGCVASALAVLGLGTYAAATWLPPELPGSVPPEASTYPLIGGHPVALVAQAVSALLLAIAAVGFARRETWRRTPLGTWLSTATVLGVAANANYVLFPSLYSEWVYTGDAFRLAFYATLLLAGASEVRGYWHRLASASVAEERRRIARDLHDGLAQELAALVRHAPELSADEVRSAAGRALVESRRAIAALARAADEPAELSVAVAAEEAARRCGGHVDLALDAPGDLHAAAREALVRVAGEAVSNALRHARVTRVAVELHARPVRLVVRDHGCGFDPSTQHHGFGLTAMAERIEAIGGAFSVRSSIGSGTTVEAVLA